MGEGVEPEDDETVALSWEILRLRHKMQKEKR